MPTRHLPMMPDMLLDADAAYRALAAHDARFDGRLFVGVTSTGIYCRPVCRVKLPRRENCRFFINAASAERAGFRPCLRCRPELAPGLAWIDSPQALAQHAARQLDHAAQHGQPLRVPAVAARLGVSDRHLRRIFVAHHGVTPLDYLMTQRLLLAKQMLTDTALPVATVAQACGFASPRRFHAVFAARYGQGWSPGRLRRAQSAPELEHNGALKLLLSYRPPYDIAGMHRFLAARCIAGIESLDAQGVWRRTLAGHGKAPPGWLSLRFLPAGHAVEARLSPSLAPRLGPVVAMLRQALDLDADPALIDPTLATLPLPPIPGLRLPGACDGFEAAVRIVLGQQVSVAAARTLTRRLVERFGTPIDTPWPDLNRLFPTARSLAQAPASAIGELGIVRQRVTALQSLATEVDAGRLVLERSAPLASTLDALRALPGLGEWTVQLIAMRVLAWPDACIATDLGVMRALGTRDARQAAARLQAWRPWRAYAVMRLWQSLEPA